MASAVLDRVVVRLEADEQEIQSAQEQLRNISQQYISTNCFLPPGANTATSLRMYLAGCGGTGKSRVIKAVQHFAFRWGVADALVTSATTGVAATLLNGMTFYKALNVDMNVLKDCDSC
jgi:hypothetical protein